MKTYIYIFFHWETDVVFCHFISSAIRNRGVSIRICSASFADLEQTISCVQDKAGISQSPELTSDRCPSLNGFYRGKHDSSNIFCVRRSLSSQAGAKSSGEEDNLEDGFSELEATDSAKKGVQDVNEDELISETDFSEDDYDDADSSKQEMEALDAEADLSKSVSSKRKAALALYKTIRETQDLSIPNALDKWIAEGNELDRALIIFVMRNLRKLRMHRKALQVNFDSLVYA